MPTVGDRYIAQSTAYGWTANHIYEWNGASWDDTAPLDGMAVYIKDRNAIYTYDGSGWNAVTGAGTDDRVPVFSDAYGHVEDSRMRQLSNGMTLSTPAGSPGEQYLSLGDEGYEKVWLTKEATTQDFVIGLSGYGANALRIEQNTGKVHLLALTDNGFLKTQGGDGEVAVDDGSGLDKVKNSASDPAAGYLSQKLKAGANITIQTLTDSGVEKTEISTLTDMNDKVRTSAADPTAGYLVAKLEAGIAMQLSEDTGTYQAKLDVDLGTLSDQACAGNDARLSDARTPLSHALAGALHSADTKANLDTKVSDADLISTLAAEIAALTEKTASAASDLVMIEDSAATNAKKKIQVQNLTPWLFGTSATPPSAAGKIDGTLYFQYIP